MLIWRIMTAAILIPLTLWGIFAFEGVVFQGIVAGIFFLIALEWVQLSGTKTLFYQGLFLLGFALLLFFFSLYFFPFLLWVGACLWPLLLYVCWSYRGEKTGWMANVKMHFLIGWLYLISAYHALITLHSFEQGPVLLVWLLLLIWASDIGAYFVGKKYGKHPLASRISPNKTLEGLAGGIGLGLCVAVAGVYFFSLSMGWLLVALVTILLGVLGDLFESLLKRIAQVKDSGKGLPGHGGIFDRLDSLVAALPFYTLCVWMGVS